MVMDKLKDIRLVRKLVYAFVGLFTYPGLAMVNKIKISGTENIEALPKQNVLFVSNHQTYFADVIAFLHIFCAVKWGRKQARTSYLFSEPICRCKYCCCRGDHEG